MSDIALKDIDLAHEIYVHFKKENYNKYKGTLNTNIIDWGEVSKIYQGYASRLRAEMQAISKLSTKEGNTVIDVLGLINDINTGASNPDIEAKISQSLSEKLKAGLQSTYALSRTLKNDSLDEVKSQLAALDNYIAQLEDLIKEIENNDEKYINFLLEKYTGNEKVINNIKNVFNNGDKLNLLAINKTALTSFQSLSNSLQELKAMRDSLQGGVRKKVFNKKGKTISYSSYIYPLHFLFTNILGGLGEAIGAAKAIQELDSFVQNLKMPGVEVKVEGTGTDTSVSGKINKADYTITFSSKTGLVDFSFGVSAKAQFSKKNQKITTTFETTTLGKVVQQLSHIEKYILYNNLYHSNENDEMHFLRRKIAAKNLLNAITGLNQGEKVLFLQYLDSIIRVDELFESFATSGPQQLPSISIQGVKKARSTDYVSRRGKQLKNLVENNYNDLDINNKNTLAFVRSRQIIETMNKLKVQIQQKH